MKALVIGSTGLSGKALLKKLASDQRYSEVTAFTRREFPITNDKIKPLIVDFDNTDEWNDKINGNVLFSAMGTTMKTAGSKENQYKVDFTYQYEVAKAAAENGVEIYCLVSSVGANSKSRIFYSRIKGELEDAISELPFKKIRILQPGPITGNRDDNRIMEKLSVSVIRFFNKLGLLKKYTPALGEDIAKALVAAANDEHADRIKRYVLSDVLVLAKKEKS